MSIFAHVNERIRVNTIFKAIENYITEKLTIRIIEELFKKWSKLEHDTRKFFVGNCGDYR